MGAEINDQEREDPKTRGGSPEMAEERSPMKNTMENMSLKQALSRLEAIVAELEEGKLTLDESMAKFEEGVRLAYACLQRLEED
ncbi:exodeoxyribonuclease VII small subunit [Candidatus Hakubella thermalkaliphila]|uniref:Exodeoxyribonuclease VII small subunit n=2 Tax=Candidatus Hakubella thermalkaliphila TaxID=2754717 RepID=A0A6V8NKP6_9ACTN|nr:exodeoxyribonuclease VII small subunit [Candidatus Hakubella thermalkaliphila]